MEEVLFGLATYGYVGLFVASFLAATILPFSSEIVFTTLLYTTNCNVWGLVGVATLGNTAGALTCYGLGRIGKTESPYRRYNSRLRGVFAHSPTTNGSLYLFR